ncbi:hypothetical protein [Nocardioides montaniterrae]
MALILGNHQSLRPGRPVLRRDDRTLQVGLGPRGVRLPDTEAIRDLLRSLDPLAVDPAEVAADDFEVRRALGDLEEAGHLAPAPAPSEPSTSDRSDTITITAESAELVRRAQSLVDLAGLRVDDAAGAVTLALSIGPISRAVTDDLVQRGRPHLVVALVEGSWRVGPFVVPGATACLRCLDAHESDRDPRHGLLVEQAARAARLAPEPLDALLTTQALARAVHDVRAYLAGGEPSTWSATLDLPAPEAAAAAPLTTRWLRHPDCGCAWDTFFDLP